MAMPNTQDKAQKPEEIEMKVFYVSKETTEAKLKAELEESKAKLEECEERRKKREELEKVGDGIYLASSIIMPVLVVPIILVGITALVGLAFTGSSAFITAPVWIGLGITAGVGAAIYLTGIIIALVSSARGYSIVSDEEIEQEQSKVKELETKLKKLNKQESLEKVMEQMSSQGLVVSAKEALTILNKMAKIDKELLKTEKNMEYMFYGELMEVLEYIEKVIEENEENMGRMLPREFVNSVRERIEPIKKMAEKMKEVDTEMQKTEENMGRMLPREFLRDIKREIRDTKREISDLQRKYAKESAKETQGLRKRMIEVNNALLKTEKGVEYMSHGSLMKALEDIKKVMKRTEEKLMGKPFPEWFREYVEDSTTLFLRQREYAAEYAKEEITIQNKMAEIDKEPVKTEENMRRMSCGELIEAIKAEIDEPEEMNQQTEKNHDIPVAVPEETSRDLGDAAKEESEPEAGNKGEENIKEEDQPERSFTEKFPKREGSFVEMQESGANAEKADRCL